MTISVGDRIPDVGIQVMGENGPEGLSTGRFFAGRTVVLFGVAGAFTPGCSRKHLPGYVARQDEFRQRGVDQLACVSVNDAFVMDAWGRDQNAGQLAMLADGNAEFARALGLEVDASEWGMGHRCRRFALIADDGVVTHLAIEPAGEIAASTAEAILEQL